MANTETPLWQSGRFMEYVESWYSSLPTFSLQEHIFDPEMAAVFSADMVVGFCSHGNLASPRVGALAPVVATLFSAAHARGIPHFVLTQDTHSPDTPEFDAFPSHCIRDTAESRTIPELLHLPFSDKFTIIEKNSLHPSLGTGLESWLEQHPGLRDLIVVGNCTDLCIYSLAMHLRLRANAYNLKRQRVIVPADAVDTFDITIDATISMGGMAHPGNLFHYLFLYHMALNGVEVVRSII